MAQKAIILHTFGGPGSHADQYGSGLRSGREVVQARVVEVCQCVGLRGQTPTPCLLTATLKELKDYQFSV